MGLKDYLTDPNIERQQNFTRPIINRSGPTPSVDWGAIGEGVRNMFTGGAKPNAPPVARGASGSWGEAQAATPPPIAATPQPAQRQSTPVQRQRAKVAKAPAIAKPQAVAGIKAPQQIAGDLTEDQLAYELTGERPAIEAGPQTQVWRGNETPFTDEQLSRANAMITDGNKTILVGNNREIATAQGVHGFPGLIEPVDGSNTGNIIVQKGSVKGYGSDFTPMPYSEMAKLPPLIAQGLTDANQAKAKGLKTDEAAKPYYESYGKVSDDTYHQGVNLINADKNRINERQLDEYSIPSMKSDDVYKRGSLGVAQGRLAIDREELGLKKADAGIGGKGTNLKNSPAVLAQGAYENGWKRATELLKDDMNLDYNQKRELAHKAGLEEQGQLLRMLKAQENEARAAQAPPIAKKKQPTPRKKGGPVKHGKEYMMGEARPEVLVEKGKPPRIVGKNGPQVIVPENDGYVIPNIASMKDMKHMQGKEHMMEEMRGKGGIERRWMGGLVEPQHPYLVGDSHGLTDDGQYEKGGQVYGLRLNGKDMGLFSGEEMADKRREMREYQQRMAAIDALRQRQIMKEEEENWKVANQPGYFPKFKL